MRKLNELVVLIQPPLGQYANRFFTKIVFPEPFALLLLKAVLEGAGFKTIILDLRLSENWKKQINEEFKKLKPYLAGVTGFTTDGPIMREIAKIIKIALPETTVVAGGIHASMGPEFFWPSSFDYLIKGEGEKTLIELVQRLLNGENGKNVAGLAYFKDNGEIISNPRPSLTKEEFNNLPDVIVPEDLKSFYRWWSWGSDCQEIITSRGCPYQCEFCSVPEMYSKIKMFDPEVAMRAIRNKSTPYLAILDDNFFMSKERAGEIAELILEKGIEKKFLIQVRSDSASNLNLMKLWVRAGLKIMFLGLESPSNEKLDSMNKHLSVEANIKALEIANQLGVKIWAGFVITPDFTKNDFENVIKMCQKYNIAYPQFTHLTPLPGTNLHRKMLKGSIPWMPLNTNLEECDLTSPCFLPTRMSLKEFNEHFWNLYKQIYNLRELIKKWWLGDWNFGMLMKLYSFYLQ